MASFKSNYLAIATSNVSSPPSETEIYSVAKVAYEKLIEEAAGKDQNLRRLVGHANLYDKLLDEFNNSFSDSDSDTESFEEADEFISLSYPASFTRPTNTSDKTHKDVAIHVDSTYSYQDKPQPGSEDGIRFGDVLVNEKEDMELCKVPSHSENLSSRILDGNSEVVDVQVAETEIFDDD